MKSIKPLKDAYLIKIILGKYYKELAYDDSPTLDKYIPSGVWFVLKEGQHVAGLINLESLNNVMWSPHIIIFEDYRGSDSHEWGNLVADYMKKELGAKKLLAFTPYIPAKRFAERMGFTYLALLPKSIKKNGELLDQYLLEKDL